MKSKIFSVRVILWAGSMILCFMALYLSFSLALQRQELSQLNEQRHAILGLADELRQSSDDLSRFARAYAATSDPAFKQRFQDVLDIRNGRKHRPEGYNYAFWDIQIADDLEIKLTEDIASMEERFVAEGADNDSMALLLRAKKASDKLAILEKEAFAMVEQGRSDSALKLLMSDQYHRAKAEVMRPISRFQRRVERISDAEIASVESRVKKRETMTIGAMLGCLLFGLLAGIFRNRQADDVFEEA